MLCNRAGDLDLARAMISLCWARIPAGRSSLRGPTLSVIVAIFVVVSASACGEGDETADSLNGSTWEMTAVWDGSAPVAAAPIYIVTITFDDGSASGYEGCNTYDFDYTVDGDVVTFENLAITGRACEPTDVERQGDIFIAALQEAKTFAVSRTDLELRDAGGEMLVRFRAAEILPLSGVSWQLEGYTGPEGGTISPLTGTRVGLAFRADGTLTGHGGCNDYGAEYEADGARLTVGAIVATERACVEPAGVMEYEAEYVATLGHIGGFRTTLTTLELLDDDGDLVAEYRFAGRIR